MKSVKVDLPSELDSIEIEPMYDLHIGSKKCDYKEIQRRIARIKDNPNIYCILGGDIINNSTKTSVGDVYEEPLTPMQQIKKAVTLFEPIKDKIIGVVSGNHERRSYKTEGIDLTYFLCSELRITDKYDYAGVVIFLRFGDDIRHRKMCYTIYATHGSGGGSTIGGKANKLSKTGAIINTDVVIVGHTHAPITFKEVSFCVDVQNSSFFKKEQTFINASATLNYEEYAELYGMRPSCITCPRVILDGHRREVRAIS